MKHLIVECSSGAKGAVEVDAVGAVRYGADPDAVGRNDMIGLQ